MAIGGQIIKGGIDGTSSRGSVSAISGNLGSSLGRNMTGIEKLRNQFKLGNLKLDNPNLKPPEVAAAGVIKGDKKFTTLLKSDGTIIIKEVDTKTLVDITGLPEEDILKMVDDVNVKNAASTKSSDLAKLGFAGSLAAAVVFLMITTGEPNPLKAIEKAVKAAADLAADTAGDFFKPIIDVFKKLAFPSAIFTGVMIVACIMFLLFGALKG